MLKRIVQAGIPILLIVAGVGTVAYGVRGHAITVVLKPEEAEATAPAAQKPDAPVEEEPEIPPPPRIRPPRDPWMSPPRDPWMDGPPRDPWMGAPPPEEAQPTDEPAVKEPAEEKPAEKPVEQKTSEDLEPVIIRDVTVGGVSRSDTGEIFRTYVADAGGKPPALCPT